VDNSKRLKELQVVNGAFRKRGQGFKDFFFFFKRVFLGEEGRISNSTHFQRSLFLKDWDR
jgi:hypothetical protein